MEPGRPCWNCRTKQVLEVDYDILNEMWMVALCCPNPECRAVESTSRRFMTEAGAKQHKINLEKEYERKIKNAGRYQY